MENSNWKVLYQKAKFNAQAHQHNVLFLTMYKYRYVENGGLNLYEIANKTFHCFEILNQLSYKENLYW